MERTTSTGLAANTTSHFHACPWDKASLFYGHNGGASPALPKVPRRCVQVPLAKARRRPHTSTSSMPARKDMVRTNPSMQSSQRHRVDGPCLCYLPKNGMSGAQPRRHMMRHWWLKQCASRGSLQLWSMDCTISHPLDAHPSAGSGAYYAVFRKAVNVENLWYDSRQHPLKYGTTTVRASSFAVMC